MKQFLLTIAGVFVGLLLFFVILPFIFIASAGSSKPTTPSHSVLVVDLRNEIHDLAPNSPFASLSPNISVVDIVRKLEAAEKDSHIKGVLVRAPEMGMAPAHAEEIRQALLDFKTSGKFVVAHAQGFEFPTLSNYVAVSAADDIWLQNGTDFSATGIMSETTFLGGLFSRFGITAQFEQFYEFKNAANIYTQKDYTAEHREATTSLLTGVYNSFLAEIALDRKIAVEPLKAVLDNAPLSAQQALTSKLVDHLGMPEEASDVALEKAGGQNRAELVDLAAYTPNYSTSGPTIAIVGGEGGIVTGPNNVSPFSDESVMNSDNIAAAIREATDDDDVKAIVFRVSSPGGSAIASEQIWAAIERAKAESKPVVISMGAYAASGGYYVAAPANRIVAMPSTITGSIGVLGGKLAVNDALNRYTGANISSIEVGGPFVSAMSGAKPMSNSQREAFHTAMARIYSDFTGKVAAGRHLPIARVQEIAKGRVWTGSQAKNLGLVDAIGGLRTAIEQAKTLAGIEAKKSVQIKMYPEMDDPFRALSAMFGASAQTARAAAVFGMLLGDERLSAALRDIRAANQNGVQASEALRVR
ncbi:MAG: signal peptide peptidase SppA [Pseudomonadota bacterium]